MYEEDDAVDAQAQKRALQELKRQVLRKVDGVQDIVLLQAILEMVNDSEIDLMDGEKDPELVEAAEVELEHPDNKRRPAPVNQRYKNNPTDWLDSLPGR